MCARMRWPMHTGLLGGINNRIKAIKRIAYGFRDDAYLFLKIRAAFLRVGEITKKKPGFCRAFS